MSRFFWSLVAATMAVVSVSGLVPGAGRVALAAGEVVVEPAGSEHNYQEKVLDQRPDSIVSEFVNDAGMGPADVERQHGRLLADFRGIGAEWIILTPHYVMPEWMGAGFVERGQRGIDDDPRPNVAGHQIFADALDEIFPAGGPDAGGADGPADVIHTR